jgi:hypothetical protein
LSNANHLLLKPFLAQTKSRADNSHFTNLMNARHHPGIPGCKKAGMMADIVPSTFPTMSLQTELESF